MLYFRNESHATLEELVKGNPPGVVGSELNHDLLHCVLHVQLTTHICQVLAENTEYYLIFLLFSEWRTGGIALPSLVSPSNTADN